MGVSQSRGCGDCAGEDIEITPDCASLSKPGDPKDEFDHDEQRMTGLRLAAPNVCVVCKMHADTRCKACETFWYCSQECQAKVTIQLSY